MKRQAGYRNAVAEILRNYPNVQVYYPLPVFCSSTDAELFPGRGCSIEMTITWANSREFCWPTSWFQLGPP